MCQKLALFFLAWGMFFSHSNRYNFKHFLHIFSKLKCSPPGSTSWRHPYTLLKNHSNYTFLIFKESLEKQLIGPNILLVDLSKMEVLNFTYLFSVGSQVALVYNFSVIFSTCEVCQLLFIFLTVYILRLQPKVF